LTGASDHKPADYYDVDRSRFLRWVGPVSGRVLEIGCGTGRNASQLRANGATEIIGVELEPSAAAAARERFDCVYAEPIESAIAKLAGPFDLILCCDVLEHLVDPWTILTSLRTLAGPRTTLAVSIPNVRHYRVLWDIAFGDGFAYPLDGSYDPHSIFDTTHLRFFTRRNVRGMLEGAGWLPSRWGVPPRRRVVWARRMVDILTRDSANEWLTYQWYVVARPQVPAGRSKT
jgi:SAM-dependent methyltransferase